MDHPDWNKWTPKQRMNYWVGENKRTLQRVINNGSERSGAQEDYLRGVITGIEMLSEQWLASSFETTSQEGKPK